MEDAGAAAVVLHSLFEEQIEFEAEALDHYLEQGTDSFAEALTYFPRPARVTGAARRTIWSTSARPRQAVDIPIIASLNGISRRRLDRATRSRFEQAGADALELNVYYHRDRPAT